MTDDCVTFFRSRGDSIGRIGVGATSPAKDRVWRYYSPPAPSSGVARAKEPPASARSGGLEVRLTLTGQQRFLATKVSAVDGYEPPSRLLRIAAGFGSEWKPFGKKIDHSRGDHFVVPVDGMSQTCLDEFVSGLAGFPPDLRNLLLDTLGKPDLELRLALLESERRAISPANRHQAAPRHLEAAKRWLKFSYPALLLVGMSWLVFSDLRAGRDNDRRLRIPSTEASDRAGDTAFLPELTNGTEAPPAVSPARNADQRLVAATRDAGEGSSARAIYDAHFTKIDLEDGGAWRSSEFVWGLVKVIAVRYGQATGLADLRLTRFRSGTKRWLAELEPDLSAGEKAAIIYAGCVAHGVPGLPQNGRVPPRLLAESCEGANDADADEGLDELVAWFGSLDFSS